MKMQEWLAPFADWAIQINQHAPKILGAVLLIGAGWLCARVARSLSRRLIASGLKGLGRRPSLRHALDNTGAHSTIPKFVGLFLFWVVWLFFAAAAAETLGLPVITSSLNRFAYYLPNVLAAVVIVFAGFIAGNVLGTIVEAGAEKAGAFRPPVLNAAARITVVLVSIIVALEQLGINGDVLIIMFAVVSGVLLATGGLAFGLGARVAVGNVVASHYVSLAYQPGENVRIDGVEGRILEITSTAVLLQTDDGRVSLPTQRFLEVMSVLIPPGEQTPAAGTREA